ncbi:MAG: hypothetical protein ABSG41_27340 [Bryobacteraceae bacterium]|jgi:hypothetical protein
MAFRRSFDSLAGEFGRRRFLIGALGSGAAFTHASRILAATEFWNAKDPSTWTEEEIVILTSKSPWAREAVPNFKHADDPTGPSGDRGRRRPAASERIIVRWESAQPILDALRAPLAADFEGHYVVSVTNLPIAFARKGPGGQTTPDDTLDRVQNGATLQVRGKDPAEAGIARRTRIGSILFGFSKDYLQLTASDRDIVFKLDTEQLTMMAKFDAKEMMYHGKLAV